MTKKFFIPVSAVFCLILSGCFSGGLSSGTRLFSPAAVNEKQFQLPCRIKIMNFRNLAGADRRFLFRYKGNRMHNDEFNRWLLSPELMLERFLREEFNGTGKTEVRVRGVITSFEFNAEKHLAVLAVDFTLYSGEQSISFKAKSEKRFARDSRDLPQAAADAMEKCISSLAGQLQEQILDLCKKTSTGSSLQ